MALTPKYFLEGLSFWLVVYEGKFALDVKANALFYGVAEVTIDVQTSDIPFFPQRVLIDGVLLNASYFFLKRS